eukprot:CAMPEP_0175984908 /NCGR_PEP_ID=MMETSP0108-20121206/49259_1 /TAXON_ID=195067 ORGANISM="Goniomonas pacifica, Strain CCMP1869" /NCGR_SAMPLE_ID=MMETSP0108 /ASSEMBLY_ACC=CAM_ASM_000204 /LENGTH=164 /DNA_ID=CAMNT_0017315815 /DNA_START=724 /DNA_END=1218 /DNA_ORIENTATION=-
MTIIALLTLTVLRTNTGSNLPILDVPTYLDLVFICSMGSCMFQAMLHLCIHWQANHPNAQVLIFGSRIMAPAVWTFEQVFCVILRFASATGAWVFLGLVGGFGLAAVVLGLIRVFRVQPQKSKDDSEAGVHLEMTDKAVVSCVDVPCENHSCRSIERDDGQKKI